jgi:hypothetical protein
MPPKLIIAFTHLTEAGFYAKAKQINEALHSDVCKMFYLQPWPASVPTQAEINDGFRYYKIAYKEAAGGEPTKIERRNYMRLVLTRMLVRLVPYLELVAGQNIVMLAATGFDVQTVSGAGLESEEGAKVNGFILPSPEKRKAA